MPQTPTSTPTPPPLVPPAVDETPSYLKKRVSGPRLSGDLSPIIPIGPMFRGDAYKISRRSASLTLGSKSSFFATNNKISQSLSAGSADEYSQGRGSNASSSPRLRPRSATIGDEAEALDDHSSSPLSLGRTPSPLALPGSADDVEDENIAIEVSGRVPIHAASQIFRRQRLRVVSLSQQTENNFFLSPQPRQQPRRKGDDAIIAAHKKDDDDYQPQMFAVNPPLAGSEKVVNNLKPFAEDDYEAPETPPIVATADYKTKDDDVDWTKRNKIEMGIIIFAGVGVLFLLLFYVQDGIEHTEESEEGFHLMHLHDYPQVTQQVGALTGDQPYFREITKQSQYFEVKFVGEKISTEDIYVDISVVDNKTLSACNNSWKIFLSTDHEAEFYETINQDEFKCPSSPLLAQQKLFWMLSTNSTTPVGVVFDVVSLPDVSSQRVLLSALLLLVVYIFIIWDVVHRTLVALVGSFVALFLLYVTTGMVTTMEQCIRWMDEGTLALLFGMMIMVNLVSTTGIFEWLAVRALQAADGQLGKLLVLLCLSTAVLSAFLDNVTTMLLFAPVTVELCKVLDVDPIPFLLSEVMFSNLGGASTMIGDPPNIILGSMLDSYISFVDFIINLMPCIVIASAVSTFYLIWKYNKFFKAPKKILKYDELKNRYAITKPVLLCKSGTILFFVIVLFFLESVHHVKTSWVAVIGATCMMLVASPHELHNVMESVEWDTLLFFAALFVMIEAMAEMGLISAIGDVLSDLIEAVSPSQQLNVAIVVIIWISAICSGFVDNIPFTTTMVPVILKISRDLQLPIKPLIWSLSLGACLGGNLTIIGASANLVTAGVAESNGYVISFLEFMKLGVPITFLSVLVAMTYCLIVYGVLEMENDVVVGAE